MAIEWSAVKAVKIPEGDCKRVAINGTIVWEKGGLPSEYQQVAYIEGDGKSWINTGIPISTVSALNTNWSFTFSVRNFNKRFQIVAGANSKFKQFVIMNNKNIRGDWVLGTISGSVLSGMIANTPYTISQEDGFLVTDTSTQEIKTTSDSDIPFTLLARADDATRVEPSTITVGRLYGFTLTDNGVDRMNLVPCYRKQDGEIGMYDLVNGVFYTNSGSGTFIKGEDV